MKHALSAALLFLAVTLAYDAWGEVQKGGVVEIGGGNIVLRVPQGFAPMTTKAAQRKFPGLERGVLARFSTPNGECSIVVAVVSRGRGRLGDGKTYARMVGEGLGGEQGIMVEDVGHEVINGREWGVLAFRSEALDTLIHNSMFFTPWDGGMLVFALSSTARDWALMKAPLLASMKSVLIREKQSGHENARVRD